MFGSLLKRDVVAVGFGLHWAICIFRMEGRLSHRLGCCSRKSRRELKGKRHKGRTSLVAHTLGASGTGFRRKPAASTEGPRAAFLHKRQRTNVQDRRLAFRVAASPGGSRAIIGHL